MGVWGGQPVKKLASLSMKPTTQTTAAATDAAGSSSAYWQQTVRLSRTLLLVWGVVTLAVGWFGQSLAFNFFGWPFGFWATAQGALAVFCGIVWYYAWAMNRLDRAYSPVNPDRD